MIEIDCRGLACPEPVLRVKNALEQEPEKIIKIIVDNQTARENVMRFLRSKGLDPQLQEEQALYYITAVNRASENHSLNSETGLTAPVESLNQKDRPALFISTDQLGTGSSELGHLLMRNFIYTLTKQDNPPDALIFMNAGVKLSITGSPVLEELKELEGKDVTILVCGTCLDYYQLKEEHQVGQVSNMYDIVDLLLAKKVITV